MERIIFDWLRMRITKEESIITMSMRVCGNHTAIVLFLSLFLLFYCCTSSSPDKRLRKALEASYDHYVESLQSEDEEKIRSTMSSCGYAVSKNYYADLKASIATEMKKISVSLPKLSGLDFVKVIQRGPTAALLYSKDAKDQFNAGPHVTFIFIRFVNEQNNWKYDSMNIQTVPKHNADGSAREFNESSLPPGDGIDGIIHPAPPLLPEAEVVGSLNIICRGYKVEVTINTKPQAVVDNTTLFTPIKGGLKFGENSIEIKCEKRVTQGRNIQLESKIKDKEMFKELFEKLDVTISAKRNGKYKEVFKFNPGITIEGTHAYTFKVM